MSEERFLVTAGLPYSNGRLHVGHIAGAYLPADTYVRYLRSRGREVRFVCGSDDNGVAALIAARKEGKSVEELTAHYNRCQAADFAGIGVEFDIYGGTHQSEFTEIHNRLSGEFFKTIHENGFFEKKRTMQMYDTEAEQFLPDRYIKGTCYHTNADGKPCGFVGAYGDQCESCGKMIDAVELIDPESTITGSRPEPRETVHWYLQLGRVEAKIKEWLETKRDPKDGSPPWREMVLNFSLGQIKQGLPERAMTRDLDWGVPVPLDDPDAEGKVLYVWFDAPIGYVSFTAKLCEREGGEAEDYARWWKDPASKIVHFIGEDNTVFHALTWPAMMMAEGSYQLPWQVVVNHFLNIKATGAAEAKIGKSAGNAIWIEEYLKDFDPDPLRYYLTRIAPETRRTAFDIQDFITRNNKELSDTLGNFLQRSLTFVHKNFDGKVPDAGARDDVDAAQIAAIEGHVAATAEHLENFRFRAGLDEVMKLADSGNKYLSVKEPWKQRKTDLAAAGATMNVCLQTIKALTVVMAPYLPFSAEKSRAMLALGEDELAWDTATTWLEAGAALGEKPAPLFRQIDPEVFAEGER